MYIIALAFGVIATIITATISYVFSTQITKPLVSLSNKMIEIRRDGFQNKLQLNTNYEEIDNLANTFNEMMSQIEESLINKDNLLKMRHMNYEHHYKLFKVI